MRIPVEDERELMELEELTHDAFLRGDGETLDRVLAEGFVSTGSDGAVTTKAGYIAENTRDLTFGSIVTDDLQVRLFGDTAVTLGRVAMTGSAGDTRFDAMYGFTAIYARLDGRWQLVAEHVNLLEEREAPPRPGRT
jgi:hypothetical protein